MKVMAIRNGPSDMRHNINRRNPLLLPFISSHPLVVEGKEAHLVSAKVPPLRHRVVRVDMEAPVRLLGSVLEPGEHVGAVDVRLEAEAC